MRLGKWARLLLAVAPLLSGCSGFWVRPSSSSGSGSCTTNCSTASSGNFYILNNNGTTPQIVGETINSGALASVGSATTLASIGTPFAMAMGFSGKFLYVSTAGGVFAYPVANNGLGTPVGVDGNTLTAYAIAMDGNWLVEAVQQGTGAVNFNAVSLDSSSGGGVGSIQSVTYNAINNYSPSIQPGKMAVSPDGKYIFVALGTGGVGYFSFNPSTVASSNPFGSTGYIFRPVNSSSSSVLSVAVDPGTSPNLFYVGVTNANSTGDGAVFAYLYSSSSLASGTLTQAAGSPIDSGGLAPNFILPVGASSDTAPVYIYVASGAGTSQTGSIVSFSITNGSLGYTIASGSSIDAGTQPYSLAVDSTGNYLLAVNEYSTQSLNAYTFDSTTAGQLDAQFSANTGASPQAIVAQ